MIQCSYCIVCHAYGWWTIIGWHRTASLVIYEEVAESFTKQTRIQLIPLRPTEPVTISSSSSQLLICLHKVSIAILLAIPGTLQQTRNLVLYFTSDVELCQQVPSSLLQIGQTTPSQWSSLQYKCPLPASLMTFSSIFGSQFYFCSFSSSIPCWKSILFLIT